MKAKQTGGSDFTPIPQGMHTAVCIGLIDLGRQPSNNPKFKPAYKVALMFRTPDQRTEAGEPMTITQTLTSSMNKKANLRKIVENWYGKSFPTEEAAEEFDLKHLLGRAALLNIKHDTKNDKTYANISAVNPLPAAIPKPVVKQEDLLYYDSDLSLEERNRVFNLLPEWLQKKISEALPPETQPPAAGGQQEDREPGSDDVPW